MDSAGRNKTKQENVKYKMKIRINIKKKMTAQKRTFALDASLSANTDRLAFFGPSGAGKTLTLNAVAGLLEPDAGRIVFNDLVFFDSEKNANLPAKDRRAGYVFQNYALFPHLTVRENISFGLRKRMWQRVSGDTEKTDKYLDLFGLNDFAACFPKDISGGQAQRVALARALVCEPELLLLDEPFSALDSYLRKKMREEFNLLIERFKVPVIMITHDYDDLAEFADVVAVFEEGRIKKLVADFKSNRKDVENLITEIYTQPRPMAKVDNNETTEYNYQKCGVFGYRCAGATAKETVCR